MNFILIEWMFSENVNIKNRLQGMAVFISVSNEMGAPV